MSNETITAEQALEEVLNRTASKYGGWRTCLAAHPEYGWNTFYLVSRNVTLGDLRRWSAPLLAKEVSDARR